MYLEVSARSKDEFEASFEVIQIIFRSIFDIKLMQRQNHIIDHEISWNFYTPSKGHLVVLKNIFTSQNVSKSFQTCLTGQKKPETYLKLIHRS